jgi:hypothetical protein
MKPLNNVYDTAYSFVIKGDRMNNDEGKYYFLIITLLIIFRLESYTRNNNFQQQVSVILPPPLLPSWPQSGFKQILSSHRTSMPSLLQGHIKGYFQYRVACDHQVNGDIQALTKGQSLLESDRVEACSFVIVGDYIFFSGIVRAMMKKKVIIL